MTTRGPRAIALDEMPPPALMCFGTGQVPSEFASFGSAADTRSVGGLTSLAAGSAQPLASAAAEAQRLGLTFSMSERRLEGTVIGPGPDGLLKVSIGRGHGQFVADVPMTRLPVSLRSPNSRFVAVVEGREVVRVESAGSTWREIQDQIRVVLNESWDPIGVADDVSDEYDGYIGGLYGLLQREVTDAAIVEHLRLIETEWLGIEESSVDRLSAVVLRLRQLKLPRIGAG